MPAVALRRRLRPAARFAAAAAVLAAAAAALPVQLPEPAKKPADVPKAPAPAVPKEMPKPAPPVGLKLPDGTFQWGAAGDGERVLLSPREYQKLLDQLESLKRQLAARKAVPPRECAVRGRVEKRGEAVVAALTLTVAFRTAEPNAAVNLGGKGAFLVAATLDGAKHPVLDGGEDGFAALVATPGDHTVTLDVEVPVAGRGAKAEIGFEVGLPRAAITTLALDPPPGAGRVNLGTHTPDAALPAKPADARRVVGLDVKALAARPGHPGYPLGPVESLEVAWEPPAAAPAAAAVQSADVGVACVLGEGFVETTAKFLPAGPARVWRFAAPADAAVTVDRVAAATPAAPGPVEPPAVRKPADAGKPVWTVALPAGTTAADWAVTAVVRTPRPKAGDPRHKGPFPVGPFAALDAARQTGKVRVTAPANTRLVFKHGPELRQTDPPAPPADTETAALFTLATGPTGATPPGPLLTVEAQPLAGTVAVRPAYRFTLTDAGWKARAELRVTPIRTTVDTLAVSLPAGWRGPEVSPPELVVGWNALGADGTRQVLAVRLAGEQRQPFDLVLTATVPAPPGAHDASVPLPRFPNAVERDATVTATVADGLEVRGTGHGWDGDQPAAWGEPLAAAPGPDGKPPKAVTAVAGRFDRGVARVDLAWGAYRPPLTAEVRAEVSVFDGQVVVSQRVKLRSPDGFPKPVRFRGGAHLRALPPLDRVGPGEWAAAPPADAKEFTLALDYPVPLPPRPADGPWKVPVGLLWPAGASRIESVVRVWARSDAPRAVATDLGVWRELPPEPVPDRDALPALTLAGAGDDLPLVLDLGDAGDAPGAAVWVERGLVQAWAGDDGATTYRARLRLKRWLAEALEVRLPNAGPVPEVFLDDPPRRANTAVTADGPDRVLRVPLPEAKPGRTVTLEVRYQLPAGATDDGVFAAPRLRATFAGPVRWQVTIPAGDVPLAAGGGRAEQRWRQRAGLVVPVGPSADDLERWFQTGAEGNDGAGAGEAVVLRATDLAAVRVYHAPRTTLTVACSVALLLAGLLAARLSAGAAGPVVAVLAGAVAVAAVLVPQPAGQAAAAAIPGAAALVLVLAGQAAVRWYYHRRVTHLPGFSRGRAAEWETAPLPPPSGRSRPSPNGSTGPATVGLPVGSQPSAQAGS